jgi:nucleotide-binding universal stress UspA family protein
MPWGRAGFSIVPNELGAPAMSYRTILVSLNDVPCADALIAASTDIASLQDAHLIGCYVIPAVTIYPEVGIGPAVGVDDGRTQYFKSKLGSVKESFEGALRKSGVRGDWRSIKSIHTRFAADVLRNASRADLVIVNQIVKGQATDTDTDLVERLVVESRRPVLIMPQKSTWTKPDTAIVAFNGTRESARAVFDSIPLLVGVGDVRVIWVNPYKERYIAGELPGAEIAVALARHGIKATTETLDGMDTNAGELLLQKANDSGAGLLVMGAYAHSRLREYVFGGATRHVLENAKLPVLMSH